MTNGKLSRFSKTAGPGILFACTAIGVSHLVQSTRAGADFGLMILGFVRSHVPLPSPTTMWTRLMGTIKL